MSEKKEKIVALEFAPESIDFREYFEGGNFSSESCLINAVYVFGPRGIRNSRNRGEFVRLSGEINEILESYNEGAEILEVIKRAVPREHIHKFQSPHALEELEQFAKQNTRSLFRPTDRELMRQYLEIITGVPWQIDKFTGYSPGDDCEVLYCPTVHKENIEKIGKFSLGCGTEFSINDYGGFFVIDTVRWAGGAVLAEELAKQYGCHPMDLEIHFYVGQRCIPVHEVAKMPWDKDLCDE